LEIIGEESLRSFERLGKLFLKLWSLPHSLEIWSVHVFVYCKNSYF